MNPSRAWMLLSAGNLPMYNRAWIPGGGSYGAIKPEDVKAALGGLDPAAFAFGMAAFLGDRTALEKLEQYIRDELVRTAIDERWHIPKSHRTILYSMSALLCWEAIRANSGRDVYAHDEDTHERAAAPVMCPMCLGKGRTWDGHPIAVLVRYKRRLMNAYQRWLSQPRTQVRADALVYIRDRKRDVERMLRAAGEAQHHGEPCALCRGTGTFVLTEKWRARLIGVARSKWYKTWRERYSVALWKIRDLEALALSHVRKHLGGA